MAAGLYAGPSFQNSSSIQLNPHILGGVVTGSGGQFRSLAISASTTTGGGPTTAFEGQGYRSAMADLAGGAVDGFKGVATSMFLSSSFADFSGSIVQALNYVKHCADQGSGDMVGPGSSVANNIPKFTNTDGLTLEDSGITLGDVTNAQASIGLAADGDALTFNDGSIHISGNLQMMGDGIRFVAEDAQSTIGTNTSTDFISLRNADDGFLFVSGTVVGTRAAVSISGTSQLHGAALLLGPQTANSHGTIGVVGDTDIINLAADRITLSASVHQTALTSSGNAHLNALEVPTTAKVEGNVTIGKASSTTTLLPAASNAIVTIGSEALHFPAIYSSQFFSNAASHGAPAIVLGGVVGGIDDDAARLSCGGDLVISSSMGASQATASLSTASFGGVVFPGTDVDGKVRSFKLIIRGGMLQATPVANTFEPGI
jgi:hypothetical protein